MKENILKIRHGQAFSEERRVNILSRILPFILLTFAFGSMYYLVHNRMPVPRAQFYCSSLFLILCLLLELIFPLRRDWVFWKDRQSLNDIALYGINIFLISKSVFLLNIIHRLLPYRLNIWPRSLPLAAQLVMAVIIYDFFYYWFHRLSHTVKTAWAYHALHHSSGKLNFLKGGRSHFLFDAFPFAIITIYPLAFFNPPKEVFIIIGYFLCISSFLAHCNIPLQFPEWWEAFFISPRIHHRHHNIQTANGIGYNFGSVTCIWDKIFNTYDHYNNSEELTVGIKNNPVNKMLFWQLIYPFKKNNSAG